MHFKITKLTPILNVTTIEANLAFWEKTLGYTLTVQVPGADGKLGFVILTKDNSEIMMQTQKSIEEDLYQSSDAAKSQVLIYANVDSIEAVEQSLKKEDIIIPKRKTFYGAQEIWAKDPSGKIIGFAQHS